MNPVQRTSPRLSSRVIACIGAGNIGRSWALAFASHGHIVRLFDRSLNALKAARDAIAAGAADLAEARLIEAVAPIVSRIEVSESLERTLTGVDYVQESVPENRDMKRAAFLEVAALAPNTAILASSSSTIPGSEFMNVRHPERCVVAHPVNPPHVIRAVEVVPSPWTSEETITRTCEFLTSVGQRPILLQREIFGFVINRLQYAMVNEALHLIREGLCDADAIDTAVRDGLAHRWALYGLFGTSHLNAQGGIREYYSKFSGTLREILECLHREPCVPDEKLTDVIAKCLERRMPTRDVPELQLERDRRLMSLRTLLGKP
jgi:L-gulonate 3-dehydrogenase